jgi:hypothetical protein
MFPIIPALYENHVSTGEGHPKQQRASVQSPQIVTAAAALLPSVSARVDGRRLQFREIAMPSNMAHIAVLGAIGTCCGEEVRRSSTPATQLHSAEAANSEANAEKTRADV